jgi:transcriptional regulator with XRE-family HTH domain
MIGFVRMFLWENKMHEFSQRFLLARKRLHLSQRAVAKTLGVSQAAVSDYENGVTTPDITVVLTLEEESGQSKESVVNQNISLFNQEVTLQDLEFVVETHKQLQRPMSLKMVVELLRCRKPTSP